MVTGLTGGPVDVKTGFDINGERLTWNNLIININSPILVITKSIEVPTAYTVQPPYT